MSHGTDGTVVSWIDGDTVKVMVNPWPDDWKLVHIRLEGYDAPEAGNPGYYEAKNRAVELAPAGSQVHVHLTQKHSRSFIRYVGDVFAAGSEKSVAEILTEEKLTKADFAPVTVNQPAFLFE